MLVGVGMLRSARRRKMRAQSALVCRASVALESRLEYCLAFRAWNALAVVADADAHTVVGSLDEQHDVVLGVLHGIPQ
jgi:hypothetical protein